MVVGITNKAGLLNSAIIEKLNKANSILVLCNEKDAFTYQEVSNILNIKKNIEFVSASNELEVAFNLGMILSNKSNEVLVEFPGKAGLPSAITSLLKKNSVPKIKDVKEEIKEKKTRKPRSKVVKTEDTKPQKIINETNDKASNDKSIVNTEEKDIEINDTKAKKENVPTKNTTKIKSSGLSDTTKSIINKNLTITLDDIKSMNPKYKGDEETFYTDLAECLRNSNRIEIFKGLAKTKFGANVAERLTLEIDKKFSMLKNIVSI